MIISVLLHAVYVAFAWLLGLLPSFNGYPSGVTSAVDWISSKLHAFDCILPTGDMKVIAGLTIALAAGLLGFRIFSWVIGRHKAA